MKIATINIDWFKKSKELQKRIQEEIKEQAVDFLIVNENIDNVSFADDYFVYHSKSIPTNEIFQHLDYGIYLKGKTPIRTSIYSKYQSIEQLTTMDSYTSICHKFRVEDKIITIYGTIIGTWGIKFQEEIARKELDNFKTDIQKILIDNENVFFAGDFNTSFIEKEKRQLASINSRNEIIKMTDKFQIFRATEKLEHCIDHIFMSDRLKNTVISKTTTFLGEDSLKDNPHKGICVEFNFLK
ncbi:MAG TPA: hypothetical protein PLC36_10195 [Flavobacterium sp.]|mgnify:CR=1 FL=1|nr:hypothetical protein [Flavobacterium sp.]